MKRALEEREYILSGWKLQLDEVSNNVYEIVLFDESFRQAGTKDHNLTRGIRQAAGYAFDIEKQIAKNWNKFLFDSALLELENEIITEQEYYHEDFGSWLIKTNNERILADGKENLLIKQSRSDSEWNDDESFKLNQLNYEQFLKIVLKSP